VIKRLSTEKKDLRIEIKIIGWYQNTKDKFECEDLTSLTEGNISFTYFEKQPFLDFINLISDTDIFIDLRKKDYENDRCLPIRLFYFMAMGRPVIFSDLKSLRKIPEFTTFGFRVVPDAHNKIAAHISDYLDNRELYLTHCSEARRLFEKKYNWAAIESQLMNFSNELPAD
jgi:glycosyltransferase involved in cell wall biosynthesis